MKPAISIVVGLLAIFSWNEATSQNVNGSSALRAPPVALHSTFFTNALAFSGPSKGLVPGSTNYLFDWKSSPPSKSPRKLAAPGPAPLQPGVYESFPYACIVVVPGGHPDDKAIVGGGETEDRTPMIKPELRLIPRTAK